MHQKIDFEKLNALDLFSGMGGNSLGLFDMVNTIAYCDFDKHSQAVLKSRMQDGLLPNVPIFPDVTTLKGSDLTVQPAIIIGGFPCQDISLAGKGGGIQEGNRSGLFYQIMRLTDEIQPRFLFLENVPAIRTRGLNIVLQELTKRGYDCRWTMLSASQVGAPHKRERWFLLAEKSEERDTLVNPESILSGGELRDILGENAKIGQPEKQYENETREFISTSELPTVLACKDTDFCRLEEHGFWENIGAISREQNKGDEIRGDGIIDSGSNVANTDSEFKRLERITEQRSWKGSTQSELGRMANGCSFDVDDGLPEYLRRDYWEKEPEGIPRITTEKEQRVERIKRLGNGVVPLQARTAFIKLMFGMMN